MSCKLVKVVQEDIDRATRNSSRHCAVAEALARTIPTSARVSVDIQTIRYSLPHLRKRFIYLTPRRVIDYIVNFDAGDFIEPFAFKLSEMTKQVLDMKEMSADDAANLQKNYQPKRLKMVGNKRRVVVEGGNAPRRVRLERVYGVRQLRQNK